MLVSILVSYCLMSHHVHLVSIPHKALSLALTLKDTNGRYVTALTSACSPANAHRLAL